MRWWIMSIWLGCCSGMVRATLCPEECPHPVCPGIQAKVVPESPLSMETGYVFRAQGVIGPEVAGCYNCGPIYYGGMSVTWKVGGVVATPQSGSGTNAVFQAKSPGVGSVTFMFDTGRRDYGPRLTCRAGQTISRSFHVNVKVDIEEEEVFHCAGDQTGTLMLTADSTSPAGIIWTALSPGLRIIGRHGETVTYSVKSALPGSYKIVATANQMPAAADTATVHIVWIDMTPDWNHDRIIDDADANQATPSNPFRFWINDDNDTGNISKGDGDIPGKISQQHNNIDPPDYDNYQVDGRGDLVDFFPVWLDIKHALDLFPPGHSAVYRLKQANAAVNIVYTDLTREQAGRYLTTEGETYGPKFRQNACTAYVNRVTSSGIVLDRGFLERIIADANKGVLMVEGVAETTQPLILEVLKDGVVICSKEMPLSLSGVEKMYRWINLRPNGGPPTSRGEPANYPDTLSNGTNVFFLHGFNVTAEGSRGWNAEIFKRLYQSGSRAKFWGMTWDGDIGLLNALNYQENVANALSRGGFFAAAIGGIAGDKIVMAHSLGNMVVSTAIQDYGLDVNKYFMLNAAVAIECYDPSTFNDSNVGNFMLHERWVEYSNTTWCSKWHELFSAPDGRARLTWKSRFSAVVPVVYNYYSAGDEIFEIFEGMPHPFSGGLFNLERYAWQKQELFKGRGEPGGTDWAGWGLAGFSLGGSWVNIYSTLTANMASREQLQESPVFLQNPSSMFSQEISGLERDRILAKGMPALSYAMGIKGISQPSLGRNYDANIPEHRPNGWGRSGTVYGDRWLHSDVKDMAYYYTYDLFDEVVYRGGVR